MARCDVFAPCLFVCFLMLLLLSLLLLLLLLLLLIRDRHHALLTVDINRPITRFECVIFIHRDVVS